VGGARSDAPSPTLTRVADPAATFLVNSALMGAVRRGTGRALDAGQFGGDVAGKTGTSNDWRDAWFVAYAPTIVVGVWVGYDDGKPIGLTGGAAAVPIVSEFFSFADARLEETFPMPDDIEEGSVGARSWWGGCGDREYFLAGTVPAEAQCGFRVTMDDRRGDRRDDDLRVTGEELRRMIIDRIRAEIEASRSRSR
jgi:membrane carboxypeptidase/penicillin-binding protein